jgi:hypothetical protein
MAEKLKWTAIIFAVIFFILSIVMTVLYVKKPSSCQDKITKLNLVYSKTNNPKFKDNTNITIEAFLVEKEGAVYLFIPGFGTQNKLKFAKIDSSNTNPTEVKSDTIEALKGYTIPQSQLPGYFNNCAVIQHAQWSLSNGVLTCQPFIYSGTSRSIQPINLKDCGGSNIAVGREITSSFGATVIKLVKA